MEHTIGHREERLMLGERIKDFRMAKRLTQEEFAELLFVSTGYVSEVETGKKTPSLPLLVKICSILDCSPNDLFEYIEKKDKCEGCSYKNIDSTIAEINMILARLGPDEKYKVYNYAKDQEVVYNSRTNRNSN